MLTRVPTWEVIDSTKLTCYCACERKFFFKYVLNWDTVEVSHHLTFGKAIHAALAHLLANWDVLKVQDAVPFISEAFNIFLKEYDVPPGTDVKNKTPEVVPQLLVTYVKKYKSIDNFQVLYTEVAGSVPIYITATGEVAVLHFRTDAIVRDTRGVVVLEHKTASRMDASWIRQFRLSNQIFCYSHVAHCLFPEDNIWGVEVNGLRITGKPVDIDADFLRVPIRKTPEMMMSWLADTELRILALKADLHDLMQPDMATAPVMRCFARNPNECSSWFGCPYLEFCANWANPLKHLDEPIPFDFVERIWDPRDNEKNAAAVKHLEA